MFEERNLGGQGCDGLFVIA